MISTVLTVAAAAFFTWHCVARVRPPGIAQLVGRLPAPVRKFLSCPWCAGAWISLVVTAVWLQPWSDDFGGWGWIDAAVTWLGASAVVGIVGSLLPDDGEPDDELDYEGGE